MSGAPHRCRVGSRYFLIQFLIVDADYTSVFDGGSRYSERDRGLLTDVLVSVIVSGLIAAVIGVTFVVMLHTTAATTQRVAESNDAQLLSDSLARDVSAMVSLTTEACGSTVEAVLLIGVTRVDASRVAYYADPADGRIERRECA